MLPACLAGAAPSSPGAAQAALAAYHYYELASGAVQIAIVLSSASIITGLTVFLWAAGVLGVVGAAFSLIGFF